MNELHILETERAAYEQDKKMRAQDIMDEMTSLEDHPKLKEIVDTIDFETLINVFKNFFSAFGISVPDLGIISREKVYNCNFQAAGTYNSSNDVVILNYDSFVLRSNEGWLENQLDLSVNLLALRTYIHELVHGLSKQIDVVSFGETDEDRQEVSWCGYHLSSYKGQDDEGEHFFENFDEAVTEKISEIIFDEYVSLTRAFTAEEVADFNEVDTIHYDESVMMLNEMIDFIIKKSGMDSQKVWRKIIKGKFEGVGTISGWIEKLKKIFGENYLRLLAKEHPDEMRWYLRDLKDSEREIS